MTAAGNNCVQVMVATAGDNAVRHGRTRLLASAAPNTIPVAAEGTRRVSGVRRLGSRGFTLIELIFVMLLLTVAASMVAPRMSAFFRGRALNFEARRMLSLCQFAQSRAAAEGVPVLLWIDPRAGSYGIEIQGAHATPEDRNVTYTVDPSLTLAVPATGAEPVSETEDEKFGVREGLSVIRFNPDGFFDEISVPRIEIRQNDGHALELVPTENRLGYELRPVTTPQ